MICAGGGTSGRLVVRVRNGWRKFREFVHLLTLRSSSLRTKGCLYPTCIRGAMLYGSEAWTVKEEDVRRLIHTEIRMGRWMCGASLNDGLGGVWILNGGLRNRMRLGCAIVLMRRGRLRWFGHVEGMYEDSGLKRVRDVNVDGKAAISRPKKN